MSSNYGAGAQSSATEICIVFLESIDARTFPKVGHVYNRHERLS